MIICTIFTALGQFFFKQSTYNLIFSIDLIYNYSLWLGLIFYGVGAFLLIYALRYGDLNTLYPLVSLTFIWVSLLSFFILNETISITKISGITTIIAGVFMIQKRDKK